MFCWIRRFGAPSLFAAAFCLVGLSQTNAAPVKIEWPAQAMGGYRVMGFAEQPVSESRTFDFTEGKNVRILGPGFDFPVTIENGKLRFPHGARTGELGIAIDAGTNTLSFKTTTLRLRVKSPDLDVDVRNVARPDHTADGGEDRRTYTVVYGNHFLSYAGGVLPFRVDPNGIVTMDKPLPGVTAKGNEITVEGVPLHVVTKSAAWTLGDTKGTRHSGDAVCHVLPGDNGCAFTSSEEPKGKVKFFVNNQGLVSRDAKGPFAEWISLDDTHGATLGEVMIPDGKQKYDARVQKEKTDKGTRERVLSATASATWKQDIELREKSKIFDFAEELLTCPVQIPAGTNPSSLKLLKFTDNAVRSIPFQIDQANGQTTIRFRTDLPHGSSRLFRLVTGADLTGVDAIPLDTPRVNAGANPQEAVLGNGRLFVKVPAGRIEFPGGELLSKAPAPILGLSRDPGMQTRAVAGSFVAPETIRVTSIEGKTLSAEPMVLTYQVDYSFADSRRYTVTLELRAGESEVAIVESFAGFQPEERAYLHINYGKGLLDPDRRMFAAIGSYVDPYCGEYAKHADSDGKLNVSLGIYTPNSLGVMRSGALFKDDGPDALLLALDRLADWVPSKRYVWNDAGAPENLHFYAKGDEKYFRTCLAGSRRCWVMGLIPRSDYIVTAPDSGRAPGMGPEARMLNRLTDWSLDRYKDRTADWDETLTPGPFEVKKADGDGGYPVLSFDQYMKTVLENTAFYQWLPYVTWDFSAEVSPVSFRSMPAWFGTYAVSRGTWTPEQREQVRAILLTVADSSEGDANVPHHSMMGGHPNFIMDVKAVLPLACATFPNHPHAKLWHDSFMGYFNEWMDTYCRKDKPDLNTVGGRWTENIAAYTGQSFVGILESYECLKEFDGTSLAKNPQTIAMVRWMRDAFMSPHDGVRMVPPQGAHGRGFEPGTRFWKAFFTFGQEIAADDSALSQELKWIETNGKEGTKPDVRSKLFTDYGPVLHYDFGGPHESYAHLQNLTGRNYRWGRAGIVYYGSRNKVWSYNNEETNGDSFNWKAVSDFTAEGKNLASGPTDQLLYDFDFAQFYRQPGKSDEPYLARGLMLVRDDYLVLTDEVATPDTKGTFVWATTFDFPEIYQLTPGASPAESTANDLLPRHPGTPPNRVGHIKSYAGKGSFLTAVAPAAVTAAAKPFGALVNGEYVFASQTPLDQKEDHAVFVGTYGYARKNQLALFQGTKIGLDGFELRTEGGDFGISANAQDKKITGRFVGRSGGKVAIVPPAGLDAKQASVAIAGQPVACTVENGAITFTVTIAQRDGLRNYEITFR